MATGPPPAGDRPGREGRAVPARVLAVVLALVAALLLMGVVDLVTLLGWVDQRYVWEVPLEASWGALFTFFLAGAYLRLAVLPGAPWPALAQLAVAALALGVGAGAGADVRLLALAAGVAGSGLALWHLLGRPPLPARRAGPAHRPSLLVAALGVPLWLPYAVTAFERSRARVTGSVTQGVEHWPVQGAVGVALVVAALVLALRQDLRALLRVTVGLSALWVGMAELSHPDRAGATGDARWGVAVTLWALLVALVALPGRAAPLPERPTAPGPVPRRPDREAGPG
ncbi:hypothetical protein [Cellulomonas endophytica]|uniref:hypothetical protein n=1 Tax=Cellulomonas endophytica TaxID=2494735 RepID=UPI00196B2616|nr:hypothetical protein [Cellulomonas endophytica]